MGSHRADAHTRLWVHTAKFLSLIAVILFAAAGTARFEAAWLYLALQLAGTVATNLYLVRRDPALLARRLKLEEEGEPDGLQRRLMALSRVLGAAMLVIAGLDRRFGWSHVPGSVVAAGALGFTLGSLLVLVVFRENSFTSSIIEVGDEQPVVETGPYRRVRHPMYAGVLAMGLATPLLLGSYWAELTLVPASVLLVVRLRAEERFLAERLGGYAAYMKRTPTRLIPGVW